jgi:hypothetical protein
MAGRIHPYLLINQGIIHQRRWVSPHQLISKKLWINQDPFLRVSEADVYLNDRFAHPAENLANESNPFHLTLPTYLDAFAVYCA